MLENWLLLIWKYLDVFVMVGGMIGFFCVGRLRVFLEWWDVMVGGGLNEWFWKVCVWILVVGKVSVIWLDIVWF